ncbi:MAG: Na/Pi cotransporter family protein [Treponema sp.]|nr:Na/Pi cotransporter family protein [Treponema sp.]
MVVLSLAMNLIGGLCLFLFGMKIMSDGLQQSAGDRLRSTLNFMTGNRFAGLLTGFIVTGIIQSSSATTVMVVSFVNAGLLTLVQSVGVIFGANIGTTVTAWIVSLLGFSLNISSMALPSVGIGFILSVIKWKHRSLGNFLMGFGLLFLGLHYLTQELSGINEIINFEALSGFTEMGVLSILIGAGAGLLMTILIHSSSATIAIVLTMAFSGVVSYTMGAAMILGANVGTTIDASLAAIGAKTAAKRSALVHVLFNVLGACWALPLLIPLLRLIDFIMPGQGMLEVARSWTLGESLGHNATTHLAMFTTLFKMMNTALFLPFVNQFAALVTVLIREKKTEEERGHYSFSYLSGIKAGSPELNIVRAEKEIRDMAGITSSMYARFSSFLQDLRQMPDKEGGAVKLCEDLKEKEDYTDEMREALTAFLIECSRAQLNFRSKRRVSQLLRVVGHIEEMSDACYIISLHLEKSVRKNRIFSQKEMENLIPYLNLVQEFLELVHEQLGENTKMLTIRSKELEAEINKSRKRLQKIGRKRIEAGKDVKRELFFIDLVRRIEKLGDFCFDISNTLGKML